MSRAAWNVTPVTTLHLPHSPVMHDQVFDAFIPMVVSVGLFALIAWIVFVIADGRRRREQLKVSPSSTRRSSRRWGRPLSSAPFSTPRAAGVS